MELNRRSRFLVLVCDCYCETHIIYIFQYIYTWNQSFFRSHVSLPKGTRKPTILNTATPLFCCHYKYDVQQGRQKRYGFLMGLQRTLQSTDSTGLVASTSTKIFSWDHHPQRVSKSKKLNTQFLTKVWVCLKRSEIPPKIPNKSSNNMFTVNV